MVAGPFDGEPVAVIRQRTRSDYPYPDLGQMLSWRLSWQRTPMLIDDQRGNCDDDITPVSREQAERIAAGLAGRLYGLLIIFDDRLPGDQARLLHRFIEVGEYGLALDEITGALAQHAIAITDQERGDMLDLGHQMKLHGDLVPRALSYCPRAARPASSGSADPKTSTHFCYEMRALRTPVPEMTGQAPRKRPGVSRHKNRKRASLMTRAGPPDLIPRIPRAFQLWSKWARATRDTLLELHDTGGTDE